MITFFRHGCCNRSKTPVILVPVHVGLDGDGGRQEEDALEEVVPGGERVQPGQDLWKQNKNFKNY